MEWIIGVLAVIVLIALFVAGIYNSLVRLKTRVEEAWSDIAVQLKYRLDLVPNLVSTVKGYASHEKEVFEKVTEARAGLMNAKGVAETAKAEGELEGTLKTLFAVAENYPDLKANASFVDLQQKLTDTEDKIQASRRFYNAGVRDLNTKIDAFPSNIIASMFKFAKREFFEVADRATAEDAPKVEF